MPVQVKDVMTTGVVTVREQASFKSIVEIMHRNDVRAVPVLDSTGQVRGVVSASDLLFKEADPVAAGEFHVSPARRREQRKAEGVTAAELMTAPPVTVSPTVSVEEAARIMRGHDLGQLPVIDVLSGRLLGIVSRSDVLEVYRRPDVAIRREVFSRVATGDFGVVRESLGVIVDNGKVAVKGRMARRSQIPALMNAVRRVEGVVSATSLLEYDRDDIHASPSP